MTSSPRFSRSSGIAIGPILFVIALLALLAAVMATGGGDFQVAGGADRITADIGAQANLIRNTINECNMQYTLGVSTGSVAPVVSGDYYPTSAGSGTPVSALGCTPMSTASIWNTSTSTILLPQPTSGFNAWNYIDAWSITPASNGGRCIWTTPSLANPSTNLQITSGLTRAASKFNATPAYSATSEVIYDPASTSQKFIVWITMPSPSGSPNSNCLP